MLAFAQECEGDRPQRLHHLQLVRLPRLHPRVAADSSDAAPRVKLIGPECACSSRPPHRCLLLSSRDTPVPVLPLSSHSCSTRSASLSVYSSSHLAFIALAHLTWRRCSSWPWAAARLWTWAWAAALAASASPP
eukprot:3477307-Rhodomonas_salina.1